MAVAQALEKPKVPAAEKRAQPYERRRAAIALLEISPASSRQCQTLYMS